MINLDARKLLNICLAFSKEQDYSKLLEVILKEAMEITNCDAGTLYILENDKLHFKVSATKSANYFQGIKDTAYFPSVELKRANVCAYSALEKKVLNINDVYCSETFDFSGPRKYDLMKGYRTKSMLVAPMKDDHGDVIGVLQLINALDDIGEIVPFDEVYDLIVLSIGAQASICLTNINYAQESIDFINSFASVMATAIDQRSPYNVNHSKSMVIYADHFIEWLAETKNEWQFDELHKREFLMSIQLHDVGKLIVPLSIMNKETRLANRINEVMNRLKIIELLDRVASLEKEKFSDKNLPSEITNSMPSQIEEARLIIEKSNTVGFIPNDVVAKIHEISQRVFIDTDGVEKKWLTDEELVCLLVQKGTLTNQEREIMESHVSLSEKMLNEMKFTKNYKNVTPWAIAHHEFINGTGYPKKLSGDEIAPEVRLLTILDIFDGLTATDRPYKQATPIEKAFMILESMVNEGKIDNDILALFKQSNVYRK